jgi:hypothetical protein
MPMATRCAALMTTLADREHLAREALDFAGALRRLASQRGS